MAEISAVPAYNPMNVKILGRLCGAGKVIPFYTFQIPAIFFRFLYRPLFSALPKNARLCPVNGQEEFAFTAISKEGLK